MRVRGGGYCVWGVDVSLNNAVTKWRWRDGDDYQWWIARPCSVHAVVIGYEVGRYFSLIILCSETTYNNTNRTVELDGQGEARFLIIAWKLEDVCEPMRSALLKQILKAIRDFIDKNQ